VTKYHNKMASAAFVKSVMELGRGVHAPQIESSKLSSQSVQ
jgi:hypothetical protein